MDFKQRLIYVKWKVFNSPDKKFWGITWEIFVIQSS